MMYLIRKLKLHVCSVNFVKNETRMKTHIEKCFLCPKTIKDKYLSINPNENDSDGENEVAHWLLDFSGSSVEPTPKKRKESGAQLTLENFAD